VYTTYANHTQNTIIVITCKVVMRDQYANYESLHLCSDLFLIRRHGKTYSKLRKQVQTYDEGLFALDLCKYDRPCINTGCINTELKYIHLPHRKIPDMNSTYRCI
jgi:hypothetical protein